jgi:hypothetical protein
MPNKKIQVEGKLTSRCFDFDHITSWTYCLFPININSNGPTNCREYPSLFLDHTYSIGPRTIFSSFTYAPSSSPRTTLTSLAELILNGLTTLLGDSVGRVFQSLFPPMPQFKGRQVVTLHNQRDFLFFRRHRLVSPTQFLLLPFSLPLSPLGRSVGCEIQS